MPTTRKRLTRGRTVITLDSLNIEDWLCFEGGWHPPETDFERGRSRWQTWAEFDSEYESLRREILAPENTWFKGKCEFAEARYWARKGENVAND